MQFRISSLLQTVIVCTRSAIGYTQDMVEMTVILCDSYIFHNNKNMLMAVSHNVF